MLSDPFTVLLLPSCISVINLVAWEAKNVGDSVESEHSSGRVGAITEERELVMNYVF